MKSIKVVKECALAGVIYLSQRSQTNYENTSVQINILKTNGEYIYSIIVDLILCFKTLFNIFALHTKG